MRELTKIELPNGESDTCKYSFDGYGRLILDTIHGEFYIDVHREGVRAITPKIGRLEWHELLIRKPEFAA